MAKLILKEISIAGKVDHEKLRRFVSLIKKYPSENARQILFALGNLIDYEIKRSELIVESPFILTNEEEIKIKNIFENKLNKKLNLIKKINKDLIGGIKIINNDLEWENSVISNLNSLKGNI